MPDVAERGEREGGEREVLDVVVLAWPTLGLSICGPLMSLIDDHGHAPGAPQDNSFQNKLDRGLGSDLTSATLPSLAAAWNRLTAVCSRPLPSLEYVTSAVASKVSCIIICLVGISLIYSVNKVRFNRPDNYAVKTESFMQRN